jgi:hypothetical protein
MFFYDDWWTQSSPRYTTGSPHGPTHASPEICCEVATLGHSGDPLKQGKGFSGYRAFIGISPEPAGSHLSNTGCKGDAPTQKETQFTPDEPDAPDAKS